MEYFDVPALAERWGVGERTIREYLYRSRQARTHAKVAGGKKPRGTYAMPEPDKTFGRSPVWKRSTIVKFERERAKH